MTQKEMYIPAILLTYPFMFTIIAPVIAMILTRIRHDWPEARGFQLVRPKGHPEYTFLHFSTSVMLELNGISTEVKPGGCILFPPGTPQFFTAEVPLVHNWFHAGEGLLPLVQRFGIPVGQLIYPREPDRITEFFRKMELELFSSNTHREDLLDSYLQEFLVFLARATEPSTAAVIPEKQHLKLKEMRQRVLSRPTQKWTVAEMAGFVGLSPSRYHTIYKATFGTCPMQDLIDARIGQAKNLLLYHRDLPLPEIAERLGYHDQFHFLRQFRKETGMTPGQYRKENQ